MKKGKLSVIGFISFLLVVCILVFIYNRFLELKKKILIVVLIYPKKKNMN